MLTALVIHFLRFPPYPRVAMLVLLAALRPELHPELVEGLVEGGTVDTFAVMAAVLWVVSGH